MFTKVVRSKKIMRISKISLGLLLFTIFVFTQNNQIVINNINYSNKDIPQAFNNFKIAHISDLHNKNFLFNQSQLINKTKKINPDIIVITGDFIDRKKYNLENSMKFVREAIKIAPIYFVSGNQECDHKIYSDVTEALKNANVIILDEKIKTLEINGEYIDLLGIADPLIIGGESPIHENIGGISGIFEKRILELVKKSENKFKILLSHRPEHISLYAHHKINLVLTGHAHGGQIRIPFIGGLFSPGEGFFPQYTSDLHELENTSIIVSRGLGNSSFPLRVFNRPEIVSITLKSK